MPLRRHQQETVHTLIDGRTPIEYILSLRIILPQVALYV